MKLSSLFFLLFFCTVTVYSQETFRPFALGAGAGVTTNSSDLGKAGTEKMFWGSMDVFITKYFQLGAEIQKGTLSGKGKKDPSRYFRNDYKAALIYAKLHLGQFTEGTDRYVYNRDNFFSNMIKGIYLGSGCGILSSNQVKFPPDSVIRRWAYTYYGVKQNKEIFLPVLTGIEWYAGKESHLMFSLGVEINFLLGDNMDGYLMPGSKNDVFGSFNAGIKYTFGRMKYHR